MTCHANHKKNNHQHHLIWLCTALILLLLMPFVQGFLARQFVLYTDAPSHAVLQQRRERCRDPIAEINKLWAARSIAHRQFAMDFIRDIYSSNSDAYRQLQPLLLQAAYDADFFVKGIAINVLTDVANPADLPYLLPLLTDKDPEVRLLLLRTLRLRGDASFNTAVSPLLDDPELSVQLAAAAALRRFNKIDFGVRTVAESAVMQSGLQQWRDWAQQHRGDFQDLPTAIEAVQAQGLAAPAVNFRTLDGKQLALSDARGTPVLLLFWATWDEPSRHILAELLEIKDVWADRIYFYPVAVDSIPAQHIGGPDVHAHECSDGHHHEPLCEDFAQDSETVRKIVQTVMHSMAAEVPVLLDEDNAAVTYICNDLPTFVFIDANQQVQRRFSGLRSLNAIRAMIDELALGIASVPSGHTVVRNP